MPKAAKLEVIGTANGIETVRMETAAGGEDKGKTTVEFQRPTVAYFKEYMAGMSDTVRDPETSKTETWVQWAYRMFVASLTSAARQSAYESVAAESTVISVGKQKFNVMEFPLARLVKAINSTRGKRNDDLAMLGIEGLDVDADENESAVAAVDRKINYRQFETAARKLVADGKAKEVDDKLVAV